MKTKLYLLLITSILCSSAVFASDIEKEAGVETTFSQASFQHPSFEEQLVIVKEIIDQSKNPVKLILGAPNSQSTEARFQDGATWIFFDHADSLQNPNGKPYIIGNFNHFPTLKIMAEILGPCFDEIHLDHETYHFTVWGRAHVQKFAALLKRRTGEFVLDAVLHHTGIDVNVTLRGSMEEAVEYVARRNLATMMGAARCLPTTFVVPLVQANEEEQHAEKINEYIEKLAPLRAAYEANPEMEERDLWAEASRLQLKSCPSLYTLKRGENALRAEKASSVKRSTLCTLYFHDTVIPVITSVFSDVFQNVSLENDKEDSTRVLIRGKNPIAN
ncbi:MAG: hypothetical protein ACK5O7_06980 [Holosporales bacterium]